MTCENEEALERGEELMEIDIAGTQMTKNGLRVRPVLPKAAGEGLPFAPVNWPNVGDNWTWRVGNRVNNSGYYMDRYLYLPRCLQASGATKCFRSKVSAQNYIREKFPTADLNALFSSFSWRIPSKQAYHFKDEHGLLGLSSEEMDDQSPSNLTPGVAVCKAGNRFCSSVVEEDSSPLSAIQSCNICCSEPNFCRDCCCILCCCTIDLAFGGYSFIRCEATVSDGSLCGHAAHLDCALRSYMAGFVGGSVGLDTEYYCRRCDSKTDLTEHVISLLKTCGSVGSQDNIENMLRIGSCILQGSKKKGSQKLLNQIESIWHKQLKSGSEIKDVQKVEVNVPVVPAKGEVDDMDYKLPDMCVKNIEQENEYLKLDDEVDEALKQLMNTK